MSASNQVILITNNANQSYQLSVPFFSYIRSSWLQGFGSQYSIPVPYNPQGQTMVILTGQNGQTLAFTMSINGEATMGTSNLSIGFAGNGLLGSQSWETATDQLDCLSNNSVIINN